MKQYSPENIYSNLLAPLIFLIIIIISGEFSRHGIDYHHDGIMFKPALDISNGLTPFRDTFIQYGALSALIQSFSLSLFGPYLIVIKLLTSLFYALIGLCLWYIWRYFMPVWIATISIFLWIFLSPYLVSTTFPWSTVFSIFFSCLCILLISKFINSEKYYLLFFAGCTSCLIFWTRQPTGIIMTLGFFSFLALMNIARGNRLATLMKYFGTFFIGILFVNSIFFFWIFINDITRDFWKQSIIFSFLFNDSYGPKSFINLIFIFFPYPFNQWNGGYIWDIFPLVTILIFLIVNISIFYKRKNTNENLIILLVTISALASWHIYYPFPDFMKAFWGASIMVGLLPYVIWISLSFLPTTFRSISLIFILGTLLLPDYLTRMPAIRNFYSTTNVSVPSISVLKWMKLNQDQANFLEDLNNTIAIYLAKYPAKNFINVTTDGLFATLSTKHENFHPAYVKWNLLQYLLFPDYQKSLLNYIEQKQPLALVYLPPNIESVGIKDEVPFVFNGEETFYGYGILRQFNGGVTLIAPLNCKSLTSDSVLELDGAFIKSLELCNKIKENVKQ